jgi:hypothetical protein
VRDKPDAIHGDEAHRLVFSTHRKVVSYHADRRGLLQ